MAATLLNKDRKRSRRSRASAMSEINVTPFVDVMLVLLIIFMVAAPLMTAGLSVDLPKANAPALSQDNSEPVQISIDQSGEIFIGEQAVSLNQLIPLLNATTGQSMQTRIYIRGDQGLNYGAVMQIMGEVNRAGYNKVALITQPR